MTINRCMGHYALLILFMLITFSANSEPDECQDFKTDVFICMNEGAESVYARYGREKHLANKFVRERINTESVDYKDFYKGLQKVQVFLLAFFSNFFSCNCFRLTNITPIISSFSKLRGIYVI